MTTRVLVLILVLSLGACSDQSEPSAADPMGNGAVVLGDDRIGVPPARNPLPDPPEPPPPAPLGGLLPLSRTAIERELEPGAGCALNDVAPGPLLVAVSGDAIVNDGGRIVHLTPGASDLEGLVRGGRFVGKGLVVEVEREHQVGRMDEVTSWQATVRIKRGRFGVTSFHHRWSCGA